MPEVSILKPDASSLTLEVEPEIDTVYRLKRKIMEKEGVAMDLQQLEFGEARLEAGRTLASYGIGAGSVIHFREAPMEIPISVAGVGETLRFYLSPDLTILDVKNAVQEELGVDAAQIQLNSARQEQPNDRVLSLVPGYTHRSGLSLHMDVRISLTLRMPDGATVPTEIGVNDDVSLLQHLAYVHCQIPRHLQALSHDAVVVESRRRVGYYNIPNNATIQVSLRDYEMMVFLKTLTGQTITVKVTPRDTVADVKERIFEQEGIPVDRQRIIFVGQMLNDNHRLLDYRIEHESAVHLVFRLGNNFQIFVRTTNGRTMVFECQPTNTIERLKQRLRDREGLHPDIQELVFEGEALPDQNTLQECGLRHNSIVDLRLLEGRNTQIFIALPDQDTLPIWVNREHTVSALKDQIARRRNIPADIQELFFTRQRLEDDRTLESYIIEENHMLHLHITTPEVLELSVVLSRSDKTIHLQKASNYTMWEVKQDIFKLEGIDPAHQVLFYNGSELDDSKKLRKCNLQNGAILNLDVVAPITSTINSSTPVTTAPAKPRGLLLFVKTLTGKTITVNILAKDTVADLKQKINEKEGIPINQQCLIAAGKQLADTDDINTIGVQNHSVLHLVLRVPSRVPLSLEVQTPSGENVTVDSNVADTVNQLKGTIEVEKGFDAAQQVLLYDGVVLEGNRTLGSYSFSGGEQLQLQMSE